MEEARRETSLGTQSIPRLIGRFAVPSVIAMVVNALYNIVDQIFIGQGVGYLGNAATNVVFPMTVIVFAFAVMLADGMAAYLSLHLGQKDVAGAQEGVNNGTTVLIFLSAAFFLLGATCIEPISRFSGATEAIMPYAVDYGVVIAAGYPLVMISTGFNAVIRADGSPKIAMLSMVAGAVINTVLDPLFIFQFGWGVRGAAFATILGQGVSFAIAVAYMRKLKTIRLNKRDMKIKGRVIRKVMAYGSSSFITQIAAVATILVLNNVLIYYGALSQYGPEVPLAVFGIVMKVNQILISVVVGIAVGAQPILGYNYGARLLPRVKKTLFYAYMIGIAVTAAGFLIFQINPQPIIDLFGSEDALYNEFAVKCFRIFLFGVIATSIQIVTSIYFQATGKPVRSVIVSLSRQVGILVPCLLILPRFMGIEGVLISGPIADFGSCAVAAALIAFELHWLNRAIRENSSALPA